MRILSWLAGVSIVVALAISATSVVRAHSALTHPLVAAKPAVAAFVGDDSNDLPLREARPTPDSSSAPVPDMAPPAAPRPAPPPPPPPPPPARAGAGVAIGSTQQALINQDRAANGLGPLTWSSCLYGVAVSNANRMAAQGFISHTNGPNVDLTCGLGQRAGENVGWYSGGINDAKLNQMFMDSAGHRANILGPYSYVATAWVVAANGAGYIAVEFS
jgi:uncharacterized protein YkwD